jgi:hypothetical protein
MAFPVTFRAANSANPPDALVRVGHDRSEPGEDATSGAQLPTIVFGEGVSPSEALDDVLLLDEHAVDRRLRGVTLWGQRGGRAPIADGGAVDVLAVDGAAARWTVARGPVPVHRVAGALPELGPVEILRQALMSEHSLSIVAMTHFLRAVCAGSDFEAPPLRAAIVFDDPNVRWRSYGFIDFQRLVAHADVHGYHAVMAMVPLDAQTTHTATVSLFRRRSDRLSLTFHGNSHVKNELLAVSDRSTALSLCAQALRRVLRFEARTGLGVDRVMTPPHGMCSRDVASALAAVGFDALCAIHPEPWAEEVCGDRFLAGWGPATFAGPSAVIPRIPLHCTTTDIALRAFMDNPVVLYGHHQDLAEGLDLLEQAAGRVNSLGDVEWMSLGAIATSNLGVGVQDGTAVLRPYAGRVRVELPADAEAVVVEQPRESGAALVGWSGGGAAMSAFGVPVPVPAERAVEVRLRPRLEIDPDTVPRPGWRPLAALRRAATEARDRAMPLRLARPT